MEDELREKLKKLIKNEVFIAIQRAFPSCIDEECVKPGIADKHEAATEATDSILFLIDGQRCEWTHEKEWYAGLYYTSCGRSIDRDIYAHPFCPCCGKRISISEVKDGQ